MREGVDQIAAKNGRSIYFETLNGLVISYVVKLLIRFDGKYYEIMRFDSAHGCPHKDTIDEKGEVVRKTWFGFLNIQQGLDMAVKDIKDPVDWVCKLRDTEWQRYCIPSGGMEGSS